ncbi:MAG: LAGLIDADG family homing endonuclease, partial [Candidatus Limnocylindrales bacterium]
DAFAGVVKSGGKTRRAAKMVILDADHPDILDFVDSKKLEEQKAWALIEMGYDPSFTGEAYGSVFFQNANHSVRVTDAFMQAVVDDKEWTTHAVVDGAPMGTYKAKDIFRRMADAAHLCGDPGIQYDSTINDWHTSAKTDRIYASNPCVTGDTLVATDRGWRRMESLVGSSANIIGSDGQPHPVNRIFSTGTKPVFELRTSSGYRVKITADHKVATTRGDVAVRDLRPDDRVFLNAPGFGTDALPIELGEAIGLAVGDGYLSHQTIDGREFASIVLTMHANEAGVLEAVASELNAQKRLLKVAGSSGRNDNVNVTVKSTSARLAFASRPVVDLFLRYAVLDEGADLKRFTDDALGLDRAGTAAILRGLFSADGTVANSGTKSQYVALDSTSLDLLLQVQRMLLGFGIKARLYENRRGGKLTSLLPDGKGGLREYPVKELHSLRISRASRVRFEREIGFAPESPKAAALARLNSSVGVYSDELIDEVASVTPLGTEDVFDLTEQATSHFVANGLVVHNCSEYMFLNDTACFAPETRISTPDGLRTVEELYRAQERGESVQVTTDLHGEHDHRRLTAHRAALVTLVGDRQVYRLTLKDGRSIRATGDHRFLTDDGDWKRVDQLTAEVDRIEVRESGNPVRFESNADDVRRWQMLGWMSADGVFSGSVAALAFGANEQPTAEVMAGELNRLLVEASDGEDTVKDIEHGLLGTASASANAPAGDGDGTLTAVSTGSWANVSVAANGGIRVSTESGALVRMLEDRYGLRVAAATVRKDVPTELHQVADDLKVAYLQGLFSADATIRTSAGGGFGPEVTLASTAPELVRSIQLLLSDLGIASRIAWTAQSSVGAAIKLHIYGEATRKFLALVGAPLSPEKQARVDAILARPFARGLSNPRAATVAAIVPDGVETVYDVTEPVTHSLIAEGLIAHNCNLASLNLMKFVGEDGEFDVAAYRYAAKLTITAQEILVDNASYPTPRIEENSHRFRPLGLGYANLGALLMSRGLAYDSQAGRDY